MPAETHRRDGQHDRIEIERLVADLLADDVSPDARLRDDLRLDDLGVLHLVGEIEHALGDRTVGFTVDDEELQDLRTVGDLVEIVLANLGAGDD